MPNKRKQAGSFWETTMNRMITLKAKHVKFIKDTKLDLSKMVQNLCDQLIKQNNYDPTADGGE